MNISEDKIKESFQNSGSVKDFTEKVAKEELGEVVDKEKLNELLRKTPESYNQVGESSTFQYKEISTNPYDNEEKGSVYGREVSSWNK